MKCVKYIYILSVVLLSACSSHQTRVEHMLGDTVRFKYAKLLTVVRYDGYTEADVADPWNEDKILHKYVLVPKNKILPKKLPQGTILRTPLQRSVVFTAAHCQLLDWLGVVDDIKGVCDLKYVLNKNILQKYRTGKIADCGDGMAPVVEKIINIKADAMLLSPFENSGGYGKLEEIGIPIVECADYMESTPLGRAEWMKFYGMIFGCEHIADSLFHVVDSSYHVMKYRAIKLPLGRSILTERKTGSTWYCPGGSSTMGQMIKDAHGCYAFAKDKHSGSLLLSPEEVLAKAGNTDVWAFKYDGGRPMDKVGLLAEYHGYPGLKCFRTGEIYECDCRKVPYFDETPFRPDFLLHDLILLLHPQEMGAMRYYTKIEKK